MCMQEDELAGVPIVVFANKQDLKGAMTPAEVWARFPLLLILL